jgi:hypothetical protein
VLRQGDQQVAVLAQAPACARCSSTVLQLRGVRADPDAGHARRFATADPLPAQPAQHLKDVMLHVEKTGDLSARVPLACSDEVGQMANAFNAMQATITGWSAPSPTARNWTQAPRAWPPA